MNPAPDDSDEVEELEDELLPRTTIDHWLMPTSARDRR